MKTVRILNTTVYLATYDSAIDQLRKWLDAERAVRGVKTVVLANVHVVTEAALNPAYAEATQSPDLLLPDGMPLVWTSRLFGGRIADRCYGPTFMARVLQASQQPRWSHYLYGTVDSTLRKLAAQINQRWPDAMINGMAEAPFGDMDDAKEIPNIDRINASGADILWVSMGCPKQEMWLHRYRDRLRPTVAIACGTAFDFISGVKPQAPPWMQRRGLEWVYRLGSEPSRLWRRYLVRNPYFVFQLILQLTGVRWR